MEKLKLMTIVGTRPEIIRLSEVIKLADKCFEQVLVHTGQNYDYELNEIFFDDLGLRKPNEFLNSAAPSLGETIGNIIAKSFKLITQYSPNAILILGDTNSCLAAYSAKRLKIPIFHMEAGNRCFDQNVPEEINRKIIDCISDINMTYTENSRNYLISEGGRKEYTFVIGSPMAEVLAAHKKKINQSRILEKLKLFPKKYIVVSAHREENIDNEKNFSSVMNAINGIAKAYSQMTILYSVHPRTRKIIDQRKFQFYNNVRQIKPLGFTDYIALQKNAFVVISDSGTLSEESAILSFPAVLIRTSTERPETIDKGTIVLGNIDIESILNALSTLHLSFDFKTNYGLPNDYKDSHASQKVIRIIQGYTSIINQFCWGKC